MQIKIQSKILELFEQFNLKFGVEFFLYLVVLELRLEPHFFNTNNALKRHKI